MSEGRRPAIIHFFADYDDSPIWDEDNHSIGLDEVPLTDELRQALREWANSASWIGYSDGPKDVDHLEAIGRELCARTASELGADYDVRWMWRG